MGVRSGRAVVATTVLLVGVAGCSPSRSPSVGAAGSTDSAAVRVTKVTDGDTIHVSYDGSDERVTRLLEVSPVDDPVPLAPNRGEVRISHYEKGQPVARCRGWFSVPDKAKG